MAYVTWVWFLKEEKRNKRHFYTSVPEYPNTYFRTFQFRSTIDLDPLFSLISYT